MKTISLYSKFVLIFLFTTCLCNAQINSEFCATENLSSNIHNHEPCVSINPTNSNNIIIASNYREYSSQGQNTLRAIGYHYTTNDGSTWNNAYLSYSGYDHLCDPSIVFNSEGTAFLGFLGTDDFNSWNRGVFVVASTNGGQTWGPRMTVLQKNRQTYSIDLDKPFLAINRIPTSIYYNNVYASYSKQNSYTGIGRYWNEIQFSYYNLERGTFSTPIPVNDFSQNIFVGGSYPVVDKNGHIYVFFYKKVSDSHSIRVVKSTNGGISFNGFNSGNPKENIVSNINVFPDVNAFGFKCNNLPFSAVDLSNGLNQNTIYTVWTEYLPGNPDDQADIYMKKSTNGGQTWVSIGKINLEESGQQFFPSVTVTEDGRVCVLYYDLQDISTHMVSAKLITSFDGGLTFYSDPIVEEIPQFNQSTQYIEEFIGDYISIDSKGNSIVPVWTWGDSQQHMVGAILQNKLSFVINSKLNGTTPFGSVQFGGNPYPSSTSGTPVDGNIFC